MIEKGISYVVYFVKIIVFKIQERRASYEKEDINTFFNDYIDYVFYRDLKFAIRFGANQEG